MSQSAIPPAGQQRPLLLLSLGMFFRAQQNEITATDFRRLRRWRDPRTLSNHDIETHNEIGQ